MLEDKKNTDNETKMYECFAYSTKIQIITKIISKIVLLQDFFLLNLQIPSMLQANNLNKQKPANKNKN